MQIVVAFRMLPEVVWDMPEYGTFNLHASLLPQYRGAAPINWAIINGESKTGATTFFIEKEIDTGNIIDKVEIDITENMTAGELHDDMAIKGGQLMVDTLNKVEENLINAIPQMELVKSELKPAPKIFKEDCEISWDSSAQDVHNFIRGLAPFPGSHTILYSKEGKAIKFKLFDSRLTDISVNDHKKIRLDDSGILFPCSDKYIRILSIQMEGKRRMSYKEFSAGNDIESYSIVK